MHGNLMASFDVIGLFVNVEELEAMGSHYFCLINTKLIKET